MRAALALFLLWCFAGTAHALGGASFEAGRGEEDTDLWRVRASFEAGRGEEDTDLWRVGLQWQWGKRWLAAGGWHLGGYWDLQAGQWNNGHDYWDLAITPVFRYQRSSGTVRPYVEGAIGFHLLSDLRITAGRRFSTNFQFGDHLGAGVRFGPHDLGIRIQHVSNGGIAHPNPGINFLVLRYQAWFD